MKPVITAAVLLFAAANAAADPHAVFGTFATEAGDSHIEIRDCGDGTPCGTVVWIDPATLPPGETPESVRSPATGKPVLGLTMLSGFKKKSGDWRNGEIYSPKADKTYSSRLKRLDDDNLEVKGCIAFLCQTQVWTPVRR